MSVSAISANQLSVDPLTGTTGELAGSLQLLANSYNALGQSLASGDLSGAQQAYASLIQTAASDGTDPTTGTASSPSAGGASSSSGAVGADLVALGQALKSGNLQGAQQAFTTLNQAIQAAGIGHTHGAHHAGGSDAGGATSGGAAASTVTNQVTTTNADGSLTVTTTYADGTSTTKIEPNPHPTQSTANFDPSNPGQLAALLGAQELSRGA